MSCIASLRDIVISSSSAPAPLLQEVTSVCIAENSGVTLIGERSGKLSCLRQQHGSLLLWSIDAQVGAIDGIACGSPSSASSSAAAAALVAVFGKGDAAVSVFSTNGQEAVLRWKCTGHLFGITAASICWIEQSPLLVTCGRDGCIQFFDLNAAVGTTVAASMKVTVPEQGYIPVAVASSPSTGVSFDQRGNLIIVCEKHIKQRGGGDEKKKAEDDTLFMEIDLLSLQRANRDGMFGGISMMNAFQQQNFGSASVAQQQKQAPQQAQKFFLAELLAKAKQPQKISSCDGFAWNATTRSLSFVADGNTIICAAGIPLSISNAAPKSINVTSVSSSSPLLASSHKPHSALFASWEETLFVARSVQEQLSTAAPASKAAGAQKGGRVNKSQEEQRRKKLETVCGNLAALSSIGARRRDRHDDDDQAVQNNNSGTRKEIASVKQEIGKLVEMISQLKQLKQ